MENLKEFLRMGMSVKCWQIIVVMAILGLLILYHMPDVIDALYRQLSTTSESGFELELKTEAADGRAQIYWYVKPCAENEQKSGFHRVILRCLTLDGQEVHPELSTLYKVGAKYHIQTPYVPDMETADLSYVTGDAYDHNTYTVYEVYYYNK